MRSLRSVLSLSVVLAPVVLVTLFAGSAMADTLNVSTSGFTFAPQTIEIKVGDTIDFNIGVGHNVVQTDGEGSCTNEAGGFMSGATAIDTSVRSYSRTFDQPGTYYYKCNPHCFGGMRGVIIVTRVVPTEEPTWSTVKAQFDAN